ncbi:DUF6691 family protein [Candidatus Uabimicrobium sp. HlEnr_7]|uniref:DUF6691 family protein n=1 Tax=Candidatus Uabimicrobium helgolandensis TaxID=3095367 RepID=UPI0035579E95
MKSIIAFFVGILFAAGLVISGMTNPNKVQAFLDIFGKWDPSLALVMVGAIGVYSLSYKWIALRSKPICASSFDMPTTKNIDKKLILGAILFGGGWGLAGFCPGPAIVSIALLNKQVLIFFGAMTAGSLLFQLKQRHEVN